MREQPQVFTEQFLIFIIVSAWVVIAGHAFDFYLRRGRTERQFAVKTVSIIAVGFIIYAILSAARLFTIQMDDPTRQYQIISIEAGAGLTIGILGGVLHHFTKEEVDRDARWRH
jgi:hypothetical protein